MGIKPVILSVGWTFFFKMSADGIQENDKRFGAKTKTNFLYIFKALCSKNYLISFFSPCGLHRPAAAAWSAPVFRSS
jgi:hypothetical protein